MKEKLLTKQQTYQKLEEIYAETEVDEQEFLRILGYILIAHCYGNGNSKRIFMQVMGNWWDHCMNLEKNGFTSH